MTHFATRGYSSIVDLFLAAGRTVPGFQHTLASLSADKAFR
ncbi:hypothetical protein [Propioniciclava sp.]|nr:hypothetical protein [Propioniciclava sp.]